MDKSQTYEKLEAEVQAETERLEAQQPNIVRKWVPKWIRRYFFQTPNPNLKTIQQRREDNFDSFDRVCRRSGSLIETINQEIATPSCADSDFPTDILRRRTEVDELIAEIEDLQMAGHHEYLRKNEQDELDAVRDSLYECHGHIQKSVRAEYTEILEKTQEIFETLKSEPEPVQRPNAECPSQRRSLRSDLDSLIERMNALKSVSQVSDFGTEERELLDELQDRAIKYQHALETQQVFENRIDDWEEQLNKLENDMEPYRAFESRPSVSGDQYLSSAIEKLQTQLHDFGSEYDIEVLAEPDLRRVTDLQNAVAELQEFLSTYDERYVRREVESVVPDATSVLDDVDASLESTRTTGAALPEDVETITTQLTETADEFERLLSQPLEEHLDAGDRRAIKKLRARVQDCQSLIQTKSAFEAHVDEYEGEFERIESRAEPYLDFERYLQFSEERALISALHDLADRVDGFREQFRVDLLSARERERFNEIDDSVADLRDHLADYNHRFVELEYETVVPELTDALDDIRDSLHLCRSSGAPLPSDAEGIEGRIDDNLDEIERFCTDRLGTHLAPEHQSTLSDLQEGYSELKGFIEIKSALEADVETWERNVSELETLTAPYLEYKRYLTTGKRLKIEDSIDAARNDLSAFQASFELSLLARSDQERVEELSQRVHFIESHLNDYNEAFVSKERERHVDLFTDIDEDGNDLTPAQQQAVIRNGNSNQVIAAAGTGKTLALVYRIAYLVGRRGVPPERILAFTYTRKAAEEMKSRLEEQFGITAVEVRTLHSYANKVIQDDTDENLRIVDSGDVYNFLEDVIREETQMPDSEFKHHYLQFLYHYKNDFLNKTDFETRADYVAERAAKSYETLAGETVRSRAEKVIADFLFKHDVEYQYEAIAEWANTAADKDVYRPDFYLPEHDIYIEHWGVDEHGEVASWFSWTTQEYLEKLRWARDQFVTHDPHLVETYDFEYDAGRLEQALTHRLELLDVELEQMGFEDLVDSTFEYHEKERHIKECFKGFLDNAKTFGIEADEIRSRLTESNPRQYHFGRCGEVMLRRYGEFLDRNNQIDFNDMISGARSAIETNPTRYRSQYDHLLVDEFQDISLSQLRLVQQLSGKDGALRLFVVGDDWQSIFSFQGAQVEYFVDFEDYFEEPVQTVLSANYRSPQTIVEAGNELIAQNEEQIEKTVYAEQDIDTTPVVHKLDGYHDQEYEKRVGTYTADLIERSLDDDVNPADVMVLCRYDDAVPYLDNVKQALRARSIPYTGGGSDDAYHPSNRASFGSSGGVNVMTVHQSKGREADHVILLDAVTGELGFPALKRDEKLLEPVQTIEPNSIEEERRLFYVALTRTREQLHIQTRTGQESPFIEAIDDYITEKRSIASPGNVGETTTLTVQVKTLWKDTHEKIQQSGLLEDATDSMQFISWKNEDPPQVTEGVWYRFENVRIDEFNDEQRLVLHADSSVIELLEAGGSEETHLGD